MGIGLPPYMATMACRPLAWSHFWWLPRWLTHAKPCVRIREERERENARLLG
jgi:hypothetical protein